MATLNYNYLTPEQAFKIYEDYIRSEKNADALSMLFKYLSTYQMRNKRTTYSDQDTSVASNIHWLQKLMLSFIELRLSAGVTMAEEQTQLKEVFKSYRFMTQHHHTDAFTEVIQTYRESVQKIFDERVQQWSIEELQRLPFVGQGTHEDPPEELLSLSFSSNIKAQKDAMKAGLRLIWDSHRIIIENVKWNEKLEVIYFQVVRDLAEFCLKYKRKIELGQLIDQVVKFVQEISTREVDPKKNPSHIDLSKSGTNDRHVTLRFELVKAATELELWNPAFRLLENVLALRNLRKGVFRTSHMMTYYELLAQVFQRVNNHLYQAFAYYNHFLAFKKKPVVNAFEIQQKSDELGKKINELLLRVLVVPLQEQSDAPDLKHREKVQQLFGANVPTRSELLRILIEQNTLELASSSTREVYELLQGESDILSVADEANKCFTALKQEFGDWSLQFIPLIEQNLIQKVLQTAAQVYTSVKICTIQSYLKFIEPSRVLATILEANSQQNILCRIDFVTGFITFQQTTSNYFYYSILKVAPESQILPNLFKELQVLTNQVCITKNTAKEISDQAISYIKGSNLFMVSRSQKIKQLNKLSDPSLFEKQQREAREKERQEQERERLEEERQRQWEQDRINEVEAKKSKELSIRMKLLQDIIRFKGKRFVTLEIKGTRIMLEKIKEGMLLEVDTVHLQEIKKKFEEESKKNADDRYVRNFKRVEYQERERRLYESKQVAESWEKLADDKVCQQYTQQHLKRYEQNVEQKAKLSEVRIYTDAEFARIKQQRQTIYESDLSQWRQKLSEHFLEQLSKRSQELYELDQEERKQKEIEEQKLKEERKEQEERAKKLQYENKQNWRNTNVNDTSKQSANISEAFQDKGLVRNTNQTTETKPTEPVAQISRNFENKPISRNQGDAKPQTTDLSRKPVQQTTTTTLSRAQPQQQQVQEQPPQQVQVKAQEKPQPAVTQFQRGQAANQQPVQQKQQTIQQPIQQQAPQKEIITQTQGFSRGTGIQQQTSQNPANIQRSQQAPTQQQPQQQQSGGFRNQQKPAQQQDLRRRQ